MTIYELINKCASRLDKVRIETYDTDFGDYNTIGLFTLPELFSREGARARSHEVKSWWIEDEYEHIHSDIRLIKRVLVAVVWG